MLPGIDGPYGFQYQIILPGSDEMDPRVGVIRIHVLDDALLCSCILWRCHVDEARFVGMKGSVVDAVSCC
jgi:hypothetical protein